MRLVTDPIVDFVAYLLVGIALPRILSVFSIFFNAFMFIGSNSVGKLVGDATSGAMTSYSSKLVCDSLFNQCRSVRLIFELDQALV